MVQVDTDIGFYGSIGIIHVKRQNVILQFRAKNRSRPQIRNQGSGLFFRQFFRGGSGRGLGFAVFPFVADIGFGLSVP